MKGILDTEVYTPDNIVNRLLDLTDVAVKGNTICDPACGTGNILVGVIERLKKAQFTDNEIADAIYGYDIVEDSIEVCKDRIYELLPNLSDPSIIDEHIKCYDTLATEDTNKYSIILMNPPYAKDLHKKFLLWAWKHAIIVISIQPCQFLYKHSKLSNLDRELLTDARKYVDEIYIMNPNLIWKDHKFASPVAIFNSVAEEAITTGNLIKVYDEMTDDYYEVDNLGDITKQYNKLKDFNNSLNFFLCLSPDTLPSHEGLDPEKPWVVEIAKIRGHISEVNKDIYDNDDFATVVMRNHKPSYGLTESTKQCFSFRTEEEANNFIEYLKTDFARLCLYKNKHGLHLDSSNMSSIPWLNFKKKWTDDELFTLIQTSNPGIIPRYY